VSILLGELIGRVEAVPAVERDTSHPVPEGNGGLAELVAEINRVINPPVAVTGDGVFIRAMEVVSDQVNEHGGRFSPDEFGRLCELIIDSPVLIAHDKRQLPVARNFKAEVVTREGRLWVKVWFYWPKDAAGAQDLASRIDSGVIREVSIGFEFKRPECSVCGADIRECEHRSFVEYRHPDDSIRPAHYIYREIVRVLETSLVYRGATTGTRIGAGLFFCKCGDGEIKAEIATLPSATGHDESRLTSAAHHDVKLKVVHLLFDAGLANGTPIPAISDLPVEDIRPRRFVVSPLVEGLPVVVLKQQGEVLLFSPDKREISTKVPSICRELKRVPTSDFAVFGWLVRASGRAKAAGLTLYVEWLGSLGDQDFLGRPLIENRRKVQSLFHAGTLVQALPYRWSDRRQLTRAVQLIASAGGCRLYPADACILPSVRLYELRRKGNLWAQVIDRTAAADGKWTYRLGLADGDEFYEIPVDATSVQRYEIGRVVSIVCSLQFGDGQTARLTDPVIQCTPVRRSQPDSIGALRHFFGSKNNVRRRHEIPNSGTPASACGKRSSSAKTK